MEMDAQKTIQLTMDEIKELKEHLSEGMKVLRDHQSQASKNKLEILQRIIEKLEH